MLAKYPFPWVSAQGGTAIYPASSGSINSFANLLGEQSILSKRVVVGVCARGNGEARSALISSPSPPSRGLPWQEFM